MTSVTGMTPVGSCEAGAVVGMTIEGTSAEVAIAAGEQGTSTRGMEGGVPGCETEATGDAHGGTLNPGGGSQACTESGVRTRG